MSDWRDWIAEREALNERVRAFNEAARAREQAEAQEVLKHRERQELEESIKYGEAVYHERTREKTLTELLKMISLK